MVLCLETIRAGLSTGRLVHKNAFIASEFKEYSLFFCAFPKLISPALLLNGQINVTNLATVIVWLLGYSVIIIIISSSSNFHTCINFFHVTNCEKFPTMTSKG